MAENSVLVVEGIHGLNERLTAAIPEENKIKIYVSALTLCPLMSIIVFILLM